MNHKNILIVDDEVDLLKSVSITLRRAGYKVLAMDNGADAYVEILQAYEREEQYDLVITDHHLPVISGTELIDRVNANGIKVPFGVITAFGSSQLYADLKKKGCLFCLDKPFNIKELLNCVSTALAEENIGASATVQ